MHRAIVVCLALGLAAALLASCTGASPRARIVVFAVSDERAPRDTPITLQWQTQDAGVQDGLLSCELLRRVGDAPTETLLAATCTGSLTDTPPAPVTATAVHYQLRVLKQPFDASDPYLTQTRFVTLDPAMYATRVGGTGDVQAVGVATVDGGGAIVTGSFTGTATFGTTTLTSAGQADAFVARIHPDGSWAWATRAGGTDFDQARAVSTLADGGAIIAGYFTGIASFGTTSLSSSGSADVFVARIHPDGSWAWATRAGGTGYDEARAVSTLSDGSAIVTGSFTFAAAFGTTLLNSAGDDDVFVARIEPDGSWAWATSAGGTDVDYAYGVSTFADSGAIVTGAFSGTATFGTATIVSAGGEDAFVARIEPDGSWAWATRAGGPSQDVALSTSPLPDGGAIVTGFFNGSATFGFTTLDSAGSLDVFVARVNPNGTWAWATRAGGTTSALASGVATLTDGGAIVTGWFTGSAAFGTTTLISAELEDVFVARVDPDGSWAWATSASATSAGTWGVSTLDDGGALLTGYFSGTVTFGATTLTSTGSGDAFVARIGAEGAW